MNVTKTTHPHSPDTAAARRGRWAFTLPPGGHDLLARRDELPRDLQALEAVAACVRQGLSVEATAQRAGVSAERARDLVALLGASIAQSTKGSAERISRVWEHRRAHRLGLQPGQARWSPDGWDVAAAAGWAGGGRDIRRAYARVLLASDAQVTPAVTRLRKTWMPDEPEDQQYRDWYDADVQGSDHLAFIVHSDAAVLRYCEALLRCAAELRRAVDAAAKLRRQAQRREVKAADVHGAQDAWWLLPRYGQALSASRRAADSPEARRWIATWGETLAGPRGRSLAPTRLAQLSHTQMNALLVEARSRGPLPPG